MATANRPLSPCCGVCEKQDGILLKCAACKVVRYCTKEHQAADWLQHKQVCSRIKKSRATLEREAVKLSRDNPNIFEASAGHFWGILETRPYMRARFGVVEATLKVKTFEAVEASLDHTMGMLQLCRGDNMGVRDIVPHLMLRLGKDQDCYDFLKWWATSGQDSSYDWGDMDLPYLNVKNADVYEDVDYLCSSCSDLNCLIAVTLLKIRLSQSLKNYVGSAAMYELRINPNHNEKNDKIPAEIVDQIRANVPEDAIVGDMKGRDPVKLIKDLTSQVKKLHNAVHETNKHFWPALLDPRRHLNAPPTAYSRGSVQEMQLKLQYSYDSWTETPGAISYIDRITRAKSSVIQL